MFLKCLSSPWLITISICFWTCWDVKINSYCNNNIVPRTSTQVHRAHIERRFWLIRLHNTQSHAFHQFDISFYNKSFSDSATVGPNTTIHRTRLLKIQIYSLPCLDIIWARDTYVIGTRALWEPRQIRILIFKEAGRTTDMELVVWMRSATGLLSV